MAIGDLVPWKRRKHDIDIRRDDVDPINALSRQMSRLFDDFWHPLDRTFGSGFLRTEEGFRPRLDIAENDSHVNITAELPGMDEKDIELTLTKDSLTIKGEKKEESEDKGKDYYRMERSYGSFQRTIPLPSEIDQDKAEAEFKKGVLQIRLPKTEDARKVRKRIEVKSV